MIIVWIVYYLIIFHNLSSLLILATGNHYIWFANKYNLLLLHPVMVEVDMCCMVSSMTMASCWQVLYDEYELQRLSALLSGSLRANPSSGSHISEENFISVVFLKLVRTSLARIWSLDIFQTELNVLLLEPKADLISHAVQVQSITIIAFL